MVFECFISLFCGVFYEYGTGVKIQNKSMLQAERQSKSPPAVFAHFTMYNNGPSAHVLSLLQKNKAAAEYYNESSITETEWGL